MMRRCNWLLVLMLAVTVINYPNPFNPAGGQIATIECTPDTTAEAFLYIYDLGARFVRRQSFDLQGGAVNRASWDGYSNYNELVGNGIYLYMVLDNNKGLVGKGKLWVINN